MCHDTSMDPTNTVPQSIPPQMSEPSMPPPPMQQEPVPVTPPPMPTQPVAPPPPPAGVQSVISGGQGKKGISKFGIFVALSIVVLLGVWAVVAYLYIGNQNAEEGVQEVANEVSPTPAFHPSDVQVSNGDIVLNSALGEAKTLVSKKDYPGTGITGFVRVAVSPDNTMICFESIPPATDPTIYMAKVDGTDVSEVAKDKNTCTWSSDNNLLFYVNEPLGEKAINIYAYSLTSKEERNLTEETNTASAVRQYTITGVEESMLMCKYDVLNTSGTKVSSANCQIDLISGDVTDQEAQTEGTSE